VNATNLTALVMVFAVIIAFLLLFSSGAMTRATAGSNMIGGTRWIWITTLLTLGIGILLGWTVFRR
jgi:hypothetical protein